MKSVFIAIFLVATQLWAQAFVPNTKAAQEIGCSVKDNKIQFGKLQLPYKIYDQNVNLSKAHKCEQIKINNLNFYSVLYSAEIIELNVVQKILIYEIIIENKKNLKTVRSEVIDQIDMTSGDLPPSDFNLGLKNDWGTDKSNKNVVLKMVITENGKATDPYYLKFNPKTMWFENILPELNKTKK